MPLSAIIIDDEQLARDELNFLLKNNEDVQVIAQGKNGVDAINLIREHSPDLVFLDVQMPGGDGFGVIKKLLDKKVPMPHVIFATAFDQYAVKAFEVNAIDYLLKPFDKKRVMQAVEKAKARRNNAQAGQETRVDTLVKLLEAQQSQPQAIRPWGLSSIATLARSAADRKRLDMSFTKSPGESIPACQNQSSPITTSRM